MRNTYCSCVDLIRRGSKRADVFSGSLMYRVWWVWWRRPVLIYARRRNEM